VARRSPEPVPSCCAEVAGRITRRYLTGLRPRATAGALLLIGGLLAMLAGGGALVLHWYAAESWAGSDEAVEAARRLDAPAPRWLDEPALTPPLRPAPPTLRPVPPTRVALAIQPSQTPLPAAGPSRPTATGVPTPSAQIVSAEDGERAAPGPALADAAEGHAPAVTGADSPADEANRSDDAAPPEEAAPTESTPLPTPIPRAPASAVAIVDSAFTFLDPPEPGAQAIISVQVQNRSELATGPLRIVIATRWLSGWRVLDAEPPVLGDRVLGGGLRAFDYPGLDGGSDGTFELHLVATDDAVDPPELRLALTDRPDQDIEIGRARPETVAPRPRPGPARALEIPRLGLRSAVVPTAWEPPGWVIGQLRETANLSEGNTVLIGHLTGLAGNVFAHLDQLEPGDEVVATSRGLEYRFVVSETMILPNDDSIPVQPTDGPRLTLMTCAGDWDPINHDYSHRLWVVAEPPELAEATLERGEPGPLTRQLGLAPLSTILAPVALGPPPKELAQPPGGEADEAVQAAAEPSVIIQTPDDGALVGSRTVVRGRRTEAADPSEPLWLAVRAEIEGSRWYLYAAPLTVRPDGTWDATLDLGGGPGVHHTIVVAPVDAATDARLRRQVSQRPGEPLAILPDAFESGARVIVERR
jgi:LPXTG-site transpeptidase (sortase) family protein